MPDAIQAEPDGTKWMTVIEAKLYSGKSATVGDVDENSCEIRDQLAREWTCLSAQAALSGAKPVLIYLTSHPAPPPNSGFEVRLAQPAERSSR